MPTEAKKATVAELKEDLLSGQGDDRGRLSRPDRCRHQRRSPRRCAARASGTGWSRTDWPRSPHSEAGNTELAELLERSIGAGHGRRRTRSRCAKSFLDAIRPYRTVAIRGARPRRHSGSTRTASRGWRRCRRARCCSPSWPVAWPRRWAPWRRCWPRRCATSATRLAAGAPTSESRLSRPERRPSLDQPTTPLTTDQHERRHTQWQPSPRTSCSRPSTA